MIDFNEEQQQQERRGAIPDGSMVLVRLELQVPGQDKASGVEYVCQSTNANNPHYHYINTVLEVLSPSFQGYKLYENFGVKVGVDQFNALPPKSQTAVKIAMSKLRAIVEAARGIDPNDNSPVATEQRQVEGFGALHGMVFPILVQTSVGYHYQTNQPRLETTLDTVITPGHQNYYELMAGGEIISENPLPELPAYTAPTTPPNPTRPAGGPPRTQGAAARPAPAPAPRTAPAGQAPNPTRTPPPAAAPKPAGSGAGAGW